MKLPCVFKRFEAKLAYIEKCMYGAFWVTLGAFFICKTNCLFSAKGTMEMSLRPEVLGVQTDSRGVHLS
jgi:hypothetical protein